MYLLWLSDATISFDIATFFYLLEPFQNVHLAFADPVVSTQNFIFLFHDEKLRIRRMSQVSEGFWYRAI